MIPAERVVQRAIEWCQILLALPREAMTSTRQRARADIAGLFDQGIEHELDEVISGWWSDETQTVLRALASKLATKK